MSKRETDIAQIRKYLNGELDAKAMHQLEWRAQDDPFLMDALEGYETAGSDKQEELNELADRLQQRIAQKERSIIPWRTLAIAASVLVVFTIGGLWLYNRQPVNTPQIAQVIKPEVKTAPADTEQAVPEKRNEIAVLKSTPPPKIKSITVSKENRTSVSKPVPPVSAELASAAVESKMADTTTAKDTTPLNEMIVMDYTAQKKKKADRGAAGNTDVVSIGDATKVPASPSQKLLQGQAAGVSVSNGQAPDLSFFKASPKDIIKGRIVGKDDGLPIVGATVKIKGTNTGTVTDINGMFNLHIDSIINKTLVVAYIGYQTKEINAHSSDLKAITLQPANNSLNEVVTTGYNSNKNIDDATVIAAHPREGWGSFRKYLKENAISPDGKKGTVKLSFMVDRTGMISGIKIITGLSKATDQAAIDLITDGPAWTGNTDGQAGSVTVRVKFVK